MFFGSYNDELFGVNLEYVLITRRRKDLENVQASNKIASQMNVAADNVTSQSFYVKVRQIFG